MCAMAGHTPQWEHMVHVVGISIFLGHLPLEKLHAINHNVSVVINDLVFNVTFAWHLAGEIWKSGDFVRNVIDNNIDGM